MADNVRYLPRLVVDSDGQTWPEAGAIGALAFASGDEDIPLTALHMDDCLGLELLNNLSGWES